MAKNRTTSRQIRRARARRSAKLLAKRKENEKVIRKRENQRREKFQTDPPKGKPFNWKLVADVVAVVIKAAEFLRDTILKLL